MYDVLNCGLFFVVGRELGHSFNFHFLKMTDLSFVRVCTFYPALSYKSHLSHCIPCVLSGHSS